MTSPVAQKTDFSLDVLGRFTCNGLDEAMRSADPTGRRPDGTTQEDARPFDVVVIGGGSFGAVLAQHLLFADKTRSHRILVLEAGSLSVPEHVQNLPMLGLGVPAATTTDPGVPRSEVWGLPWRSDIAFPGLAYTFGGRSLYFGGWAPEPLEAETTSWPKRTLEDLRGPLADGREGYFHQAAEQIGVTESNDFIFGTLHVKLRKRLLDAIGRGDIRGAVPVDELPGQITPGDGMTEQEAKLEAPLAVQGRAPRSGFFPMNKFSSVPLLVEAARAAFAESAGDDVKKRLMIVPFCHVTRLATSSAASGLRVTRVETNQGPIDLPPGGRVVIAAGTLESTRLALSSFRGAAGGHLIGQNLIGHLRSNLTIRMPVAALGSDLREELQASALFIKGRHRFEDGSFGFFHLQVTAAGLDKPGADSEAELFKKNPDIDLFHRFRHITDSTVIVTVRAIGEMEPQNPASTVSLSGELDEFGAPRAWVSLKASTRDDRLWTAMDEASDDAALALVGESAYEVFVGGGRFVAAAAGQSPADVLPHRSRRDGLGTTHHEAGTLWMGDDAEASVTDEEGRFHSVENAYVAGPALFPSVGSPNPMLTGTALARRLADRLARRDVSVEPDFVSLFDGMTLHGWRMSTISNQPGKNDPGRFHVVDAALEGVPGSDMGMLWQTDPLPADFLLRLEWLQWRDDANSGVFIRFPHPDSKGYDNTAWVAVDFGFEIQIDNFARPDGNPVHKTGALYGFAGPERPDLLPLRPRGEWNDLEITVRGQTYAVSLNGQEVTRYDNTDPVRGAATVPGRPTFLGLQTHTGRVAFRRIRIKPL